MNPQQQQTADYLLVENLVRSENMGAIFDDELKRLRSHFMEMGIDASEQIYQATKGL